MGILSSWELKASTCAGVTHFPLLSQFPGLLVYPQTREREKGTGMAGWKLGVFSCWGPPPPKGAAALGLLAHSSLALNTLGMQDGIPSALRLASSGWQRLELAQSLSRSVVAKGK